MVCEGFVSANQERTYTSGTFYAPATGGTRTTDEKGIECFIASTDMSSSNSTYYQYGGAAGVRPVVTLNSSIKVDVSDTTSDGTSVSTAWKLTK